MNLDPGKYSVDSVCSWLFLPGTGSLPEDTVALALVAFDGKETIDDGVTDGVEIYEELYDKPQTVGHLHLQIINTIETQFSPPLSNSKNIVTNLGKVNWMS